MKMKMTSVCVCVVSVITDPCVAICGVCLARGGVCLQAARE